MNWLRHPNGGGRIYGNDAEAHDSFIDRRSSIYGDSNIHTSEIYDSQIYDSQIIGAVVRDSVLTNCRTWNAPVINAVTLIDVVVFGDAWLIGPWSLAAPVRIHAGVWEEAPRWDICEGNGLRVGISECTEGRMHLGCRCLSLEKWCRPGYRQRIGRVAGWTDNMIELAYQRFNEWK